MSEIREVIRCPHCAMNQFMTMSELCRRCQKPLVVERPEEPTPEVMAEPVAEQAPRDSTLSALFARNVLATRTRRGWSQKDVTDRMGTSRTYLTKVENGYCLPTLDTVERLAAALEVAPVLLFHDPEDPTVEGLLADPFLYSIAVRLSRLNATARERIIHHLHTIKPAA